VHTLWTEAITTGIGWWREEASNGVLLLEHGRVKHNYCCQNIIWTIVDILVGSGLTCKKVVAIDCIYGIYEDDSQTFVTKIITNRIKK
jgi:hypothetical protein